MVLISVIARFLIPYIVVLCLPFAMGMFIYDRMIGVVESKSVESNMVMLEQTQKVLERRLAEVEMIAQQIKRDPKVVAFQNVIQPLQGIPTYKTVELRDSLRNYGLTNNFIADYYILFRSGQLAVNADQVYTLPNFYDQFFRESRLSYESWYNQLLDAYHPRDFVPERQLHARDSQGSPVVTYVQSLGFPQFYYGAVVMFINNTEFSGLLRGNRSHDGVWAYIADNKGQIITSTAGGPDAPVPINRTGSSGSFYTTIQGTEMLVAYTTSPSNGWTYVAAQPAHVVLESVRYIRQITFSFTLAALAAGLLMALWMAYRNSRPIRSIQAALAKKVQPEEGRPRDTLGFIQSAVADLIVESEELRLEMSEQLPLLKASFLDRLLKGEFERHGDIILHMNHLKLKLDGDYYGVAVASLPEYGKINHAEELDDLDRKKLLLKNTWMRKNHGNECFHDRGGENIVFLFSCCADSKEEARTIWAVILQEILDEMREQHAFHPLFAVGGIYPRLSELSTSYEEAQQTRQVQDWGAPLLWYDEVKQADDKYVYPDNTALRLANNTRAGRKDAAEEILTELRTENFIDRRLSLRILRLFISDMCGQMVKQLDQIRLEDEALDQLVQKVINDLGKLKSAEEALQLFDLIAGIHLQVCDEVSARKKNNQTALKDEILQDITASYRDPQFGLTFISDKYLFSEAYISQFFKEHVGMNFFDYVEQLRLSEAKTLLTNTDISIQDIALQVGYSSYNSFGRAFKRLNGVSAKVFRESLK